jgi:CheY-like chemotaxis protein
MPDIIGAQKSEGKFNKISSLRSGKNHLKSLPASIPGCYLQSWSQDMKKPATPPAVQHTVIPLAEIPQAVLRGATIISPKKTPHTARKRSQRGPQAAQSIKVMIVDDESSVADTAARVLGMFGYECYAVYNAADALACAESFTPDVVLSDVIMKGMNGIELCIDIKKMLPNTRILLFSGQVSTAYALMQDSGKQGHSFELLAKPLRPEELATKIGALFGGAYSPLVQPGKPRHGSSAARQ